MKLRLFCDFDGTIAKNDVGNLIFTTFGDPGHWWFLVDQWRNGLIDGRDLWRKQCQVSKMTEQELDEFAATQPVDPAFPAFVTFCEKHNIPVYVVSDGMDAYISRILRFNGIDNLEIRANHLKFHQDGRLSVEFPYYQKDCCNCGNCKGYHVEKEKQPGETTVYIGDGHSDVCGLKAADITFAKGYLLDFCREINFECKTFNTFNDVQNQLKMLVGN